MSKSNNAPGVATATVGTTSTSIADPKEASREIRKKLIIWTTFSVIVSSLPVVLNIMVLFSNNKPIVLFDLLAHGELLLISVAIAANTIGDMIYSKKLERTRDIAYICGCFLIIILSVSWFSSLGIGGKAANISGFGLTSLGLFVATIVVSGICTLRTEAPNVHS